jgi:O-antigen ligase
LFGFEGAFGAEGDGFVYPHNDFVFLFVELGIPGVGLLIAFWLALIRRIRVLSHWGTNQARYAVRLLVPVIAMMLLVQLFDNGFAIRFVAERFFVAAGLVFGLRAASRHPRADAIDQGSRGTS